ncbi:MAG: MtrB/PioB family outer membrane beta-barrel protein [Rhodospirillaceae bacterium]
MKRTHLLIVVLACGFLAASTPLLAQTAGAVTPENWFNGKATLLLLGRDNVDSSKFQEYMLVPKGVSMPVFTLQGRHDGNDFALFGQNISKQDQRYFGWAEMKWLGVAFDYNSIIHNMGFNGRTLFTETASGVWSMSATTRKALSDASFATGVTRNYPFYADLLAPTLATANYVDLTSLRQRGNVEFDLSKQLPFDLQVTYLREVKTGARGESSGDVLGSISPVVAAPETMNEVTEDFGLRWAYNFKTGNVYARFNRNTYDDRLNGLYIDNPFLPADTLYTSSSVPGGPGTARFSTSPDNEASRGMFGFLYKMKKQTRFSADLAFNSWTQNEAFLPYTNNSTTLTTAGAPTNTTASLQQSSFNGKINTSMYNFAFSSRPVDGLGIRVRYRVYDLTNKTNRYVITGDASGSPDRTFSAVTPTTSDPYGHATANVYDNSSKRFDLQATYDFSAFALEGYYRNGQLKRTSREADSGTENTYGVAAVYRTGGMVDFKAIYDSYKRTADGETIYGFQEDEAEKTVKRTGLEVELSPVDNVGLSFTYYRNNREYPDRPDRVAVASGVPVPGQGPYPGTPSGLLQAKYDTYTLDFEYVPNDRAELGAWYTYEKYITENQWSSTNSASAGYGINNLLNYKGTDRGDSFGVNAAFTFVPEKWKLAFMFTRQKVDGLMDITARETGSFYTPGRTTLIPPGQGGAADIVDYDDTEWTTANLNLAYTYNAKTTFSVGYAYDKYNYSDAFNANNSLFPQAVLFYLQENNGNYTANIVYAKLTYRF